MTINLLQRIVHFLYNILFNPFQPSVAFHIETSHLICCANQMTGFYMKRNTGLKWVKGDIEGEHWSSEMSR